MSYILNYCCKKFKYNFICNNCYNIASRSHRILFFKMESYGDSSGLIRHTAVYLMFQIYHKNHFIFSSMNCVCMIFLLHQSFWTVFLWQKLWNNFLVLETCALTLLYLHLQWTGIFFSAIFILANSLVFNFFGFYFLESI